MARDRHDSGNRPTIIFCESTRLQGSDCLSQVEVFPGEKISTFAAIDVGHVLGCSRWDGVVTRLRGVVPCMVNVESCSLRAGQGQRHGQNGEQQLSEHHAGDEAQAPFNTPMS